MAMQLKNPKLVASLQKQNTRALIALVQSLRHYQSHHPKMHSAQSKRLYFSVHVLIARGKKGNALAKAFIDS
jgi:hypothetical protein